MILLNYLSKKYTIYEIKTFHIKKNVKMTSVKVHWKVFLHKQINYFGWCLFYYYKNKNKSKIIYVKIIYC